LWKLTTPQSVFAIHQPQPGSIENKFAEMLMLIDFFQFADAAGLPLPEDSRQLRNDLEDWLISFARMYRKDKDKHGLRWPPSNLLSIMALAQHYGVPTRLLDWSRSAHTASLFRRKRSR